MSKSDWGKVFIGYKYELKARRGENRNNLEFDVTILFSLDPNDHAKIIYALFNFLF